jgi:protein involved in ribonucleotide reduction
MSISVGILYFSPTSTTKRLIVSVALGLGVKNPEIIDMTRPDIREKIKYKPDEVTANFDYLAVGAPVYSGKLPIEVIECLKSINGNGKKSIAIVVYGNRDYGKALYCMVEKLL